MTNAQLVRVNKRLTLHEVANAAWLHAGDVSRIERGITKPSEIHKECLAAALGIEPDELLEKSAL